MTRRASAALAALLIALAVGVCWSDSGITSLTTFPGGSNGQVQYNHGGYFGGVPLSSTTLTQLPVSTGTLRADLSAETARATARENAIATSTGSTTTALSAEIARALAAEGVNTAAVNSTGTALTLETSARSAADVILTSAVNSTGSAVTLEAQARAAADATLTAAVNSTGTALTTETSARAAADLALTASRASTGTSVGFSTIGVLQDGAAYPPYYGSAPLVMVARANGYVQAILQNLSNGVNASGDFAIANDLGANTSYYINLGINSSKFSQAAFSSQRSSAAYLTSSDSDLFVWSDINGGLNGAQTGSVILGSSNPVTANIAAEIMPATAGGPGALVVFSSETNKSAAGIQAQSFQGSSATLTNGLTASSATLTATGSAQYSAHLSSGELVDQGDIKVTNGCVILKNGTLCGGVATSYSLNVAIASSTAGGSTASTSYVALAGSTATITLAAGNVFVQVDFYVTGNNSAGGNTTTCALMRGATTIETRGAGSGSVAGTAPGASYVFPIHLQYVNAALGAGTYTFSVMCKVNGGTWTYDAGYQMHVLDVH